MTPFENTRNNIQDSGKQKMINYTLNQKVSPNSECTNAERLMGIEKCLESRRKNYVKYIVRSTLKDINSSFASF